MGIFLRHSYNTSPSRWGSVADIQYAIKVNSEKVYGIDARNIILSLPLFWGFPLIDYTYSNSIITNNGCIYIDGKIDFNGSNNFIGLGNNDNLGISQYDEFSISALVDLHTTTSDKPIFSRGMPNAINLLWWDIGDSKWEFFVRDSASGLHYAKHHTPAKLHTNQSIIGNWDGTEIKIFVDGIVGDTTSAITIPGNESGDISYIGIRAETSNKFNGYIYTTNLFKCSLTEDQVFLLNDRPFSLYQKVSRPFYLLPSATVPTTNFYDLNTEISGGSETLQDLTTDIQVVAKLLIDLQTEISATTIQTVLDLNTEIAADYNISFKDLNTNIQTTAESFADLNTEITASSYSVFFDLNTEIATSALSLYDLNTEVITNAQTISDLNTEIQVRGDTFYDLTTDIRAVAGSELLFYDLNTEISSVRSKYWLDTEIEALSYAKWSFRTEWNPNRFLSTEIAAKKPYSFSFKTQTGSSYAASSSEIEIFLSGYTWPLRTLFLDYLRVGTSNVYNFELWWARGQSGKNSLKNAKIKAEYTTTQFAGGYEVVTCDWLTCRVNGGAEQTINETFADLGNMPCDSKLDIELTVDCRDCSISRGLIFFKLIIVGDSKEAIYGAPIVYGEGTQYFEGEYDNYTADNFICRLYVV